MGINMAWNYNNPQEYLEMIRKGNMPPLIISVALTGGLQGKEVNPNLPETPDEQAQQFPCINLSLQASPPKFLLPQLDM
jgi:hypothetical protein